MDEPSARAPAAPDASSAALERLLERFRRGDRPALARAISVVEDERPGFHALLHAVLARGLRAHRVGFTGPPGAGKSSLVSAVATRRREAGEEVGIVAVDPTSPYSGGALLGDRIRMNDLATDPGIFIRSMATRGSLGGLATTTREVIDLMDGFGFPHVLVETVGVGQTELEITGAADTVVVVLVPESGDAVQAMKAGLMEIADVFLVNKADRPGADRLAKELRMAIHLRSGEGGRNVPAHHGIDLSRVARRAASRESAVEERAGGGRESGPERSGGSTDAESGEGGAAAAAWTIPVLKTVAQSGEGVPELLETIQRHGEYLRASGELERRRRERAAVRVRDVVERRLRRLAWEAAGAPDIVGEGLERIGRGEATPYSLAAEVVSNLLGRDPGLR